MTALVLVAGCTATSTGGAAPSMTAAPGGGTAVPTSVPPWPTTAALPGATVPATVPATASAPVSSPAATTVAPPVLQCALPAERMVAGHRVVLSAPASANAPLPVVVAVHGYKGTPEGLQQFSELDGLALGGVAVVAYPSGTPLDLGFGWNSGAGRFATESGDDVALLGQVIDDVLGSACADPARVYLVGESNGGGMALRAACDPRMSGRIAGLIAVNPAIDQGVLATCSAVAVPVSLLAVVGEADATVPPDGSRQPFVAATAWFATVTAALEACSGAIVDGQLSEMVAVSAPTQCGACAALYTVHDGTHTWPGSAAGSNGLRPGSFELTALMAEVVAGRRDGCGLAA